MLRPAEFGDLYSKIVLHDVLQEYNFEGAVLSCGVQFFWGHSNLGQKWNCTPANLDVLQLT